ncbi:PulJ/GspJ family protein [Paraglaciecola aestuariivivens]
MKTNKRGFSLVEAIVALVVLSLVFTAVWGWFGTATKSTNKIDAAVALPEVFSQFLVHLELEPLKDVQQGQVVVGEYVINWSSQPIRQSDQENYRRQPAWIVTLFSVQGEILKNQQLVSAFSTKTVRQWRDPNYVEPPGFDE